MNGDLLNRDLYEILGVPADASDAEISRAYRKLAREHHPDVQPDDPAAEDRFKDISAAYDVLGDADKRAEYDEFRAMVGTGGFTGEGFGPFSGDAFDLSDLLSGVFRMPRMVQLQLSFDDAMRGATIGIDGQQVHIPAGVADGETLQVGPDLLVAVSVGTHPMFRRDGDDLHVEVPISFPRAALGGTVEVPTYDGGPVKIRVPAGTRSGRTFRVRGRGARGGDLLASVVVAVPSELTDEQRSAIQGLEDLL